MYLRNAFAAVLFISAFFSLALAQTSPTESQSEKEKARKELEKRVLQMLDQAISDAQSLKLAQNRAVVYAISGELYWKFDEKRARELFRNSANEILVANAEAEKQNKESDDPYYQYNDLSDIRGEVLPLIAVRDAELALDILVQTRPAKITEALNKASDPNAKQEGSFFNFNPDQFRIQQEIALEQRFAVLAAEQNPEQAIKLIKDSLAKGLSHNILQLLQKLNKKDEKKAVALADDVIGKIVDTDLTKKTADFAVAIRFLQISTDPNVPKNPKEKIFRFTETQQKRLAGKLADSFLQPSNSLETTIGMVQILPDLERLVPEKAALLKQKQAESLKNLPPELKLLQQQQKLWNPNSSPEEILTELPKLNEYEKASAYQALAHKISQIDDDSRAKKLIEQIPDQKARERAVEQYESSRIIRAANEGKLDEAKKMIGNLSKKKTQIQRLVQLALEFHKKATEKDRETAANLMRDAKALTAEFPEDEDELNDAMEIVKGYAVVNPDEAFRIFEPIVDQLNEYVQASAVLSKFNRRDRTFRKGEVLMKVRGYSWDGLLLFRYIPQIQMLGKADLDRMSLYADKFQRSDARTIVKLFIAQGFLKEDKGEANASGGGVVYFDY